MGSKKAIVLAALLGVAIAGCSGSDDDSGSGVGGVDAPCGDLDTVTLSGTLDGKPVDGTHKRGNYAFNQLSTPKRFDGTWTDGAVSLQWAELAASGQVVTTTAATLRVAGDSAPRTAQSARFVYTSDRAAGESVLKAALTLPGGDVSVCVRKKD